MATKDHQPMEAIHIDADSHHPQHRHDFAQICYIPEGEFDTSGKTHTPGAMIFHTDPHGKDERTDI